MVQSVCVCVWAKRERIFFGGKRKGSNEKDRADCCHKWKGKMNGRERYMHTKCYDGGKQKTKCLEHINIMLKLNTRWAMTYTLNMKCDYDRCAHDKNTNKVPNI